MTPLTHCNACAQPVARAPRGGGASGGDPNGNAGAGGGDGDGDGGGVCAVDVRGGRQSGKVVAGCANGFDNGCGGGGSSSNPLDAGESNSMS